MSFNSKYTGQQIEDLLDKVDKGSVGGVGYPVVTVTDNFNIEAQPNTFYNIKNSGEDSVNISIDPTKYSVDEQEKLTMFICDELIQAFSDDAELDLFFMPLLFGGRVIPDTSIEGFQYRFDITPHLKQWYLELYATVLQTSLNIDYYFSDNLNVDGVSMLLKLTSEDGQMSETIPLSMTNVQILTDYSDELAYVTVKDGYNESDGLVLPDNMPHVFIEVENDNEEYQYKYQIFGLIQLMFGYDYLYSNEPYNIAQNAYTEGGSDVLEMCDIKFVKNIPTSGCEVANEYVFNINSPANVTFNQDIKWNNGNEPDLSQNGTYTISLLNGVGCFTFVE